MKYLNHSVYFLYIFCELCFTPGGDIRVGSGGDFKRNAKTCRALIRVPKTKSRLARNHGEVYVITTNSVISRWYKNDFSMRYIV